MGYLYFKVDEEAIRRKLNDELASRPDVQAKATAIAENLFNRAHESMMKDFLEHKITQELKAGNEASNISNTLNGEGNLFTFLGFYVGQDPTWDLEELLNKMYIRKTQQRGNVINFRIENMPTTLQITDATRMNWGDASWALAVENGDFKGGADLAHFIFKSWEGARSEEGFQVKGYEYSEENFNPQPYLSEIFEHFQERVNNTKSKFVV